MARDYRYVTFLTFDVRSHFANYGGCALKTWG